ncbi:MAG TPA: 3-phosphoshikimate 1-carboxyvinyltransferase [Opitutaceae bacterium]|nr:3-phosphoshikimate 1-carboxyvinyltransferase [Opitutaceae bacterium]
MTTSLPDILAVKPFTRPSRGEATVPGSKSLTNRAMLLAALCDGPVTLTGALLSEDTEIMAEALRRLGFDIVEDEDSCVIEVGGLGGAIRATDADLFVGLAGTAARFLTALCCCAKRGTFKIDGIPQMRKRPMKGLIDALRALGADVRCLGEEGFFPLEIHARGLGGGSVAIDAHESSQMLSALLMVAPLSPAPVVVTPVGGVRKPFVRMTLRQMAQFGVGSRDHLDVGDSITVSQGSYASPGRYAVEPDASAASYFAALPLVTGGSISLTGLRVAADSLQGDIRFLDVLAKAGASVTHSPSGITLSRKPGTRLSGADTDFSPFSDTFLTLAAISPLLEGKTVIRGIAHTRKQETDRVAGIAAELRRLGQEVVETEDSLEIHPGKLREDVTVETYGDHRFAMSFAVLGCHDLRGDGSSWLSIANPACSAKTFPGFFDLLESVRAKSLEA